nr:PAS domain S-box protein [uncultured Desulfobulbus sp.]
MQPDNDQLISLLQTLPGAFFACDAQFHIWYCSQEALDLLQYNPLPSPGTQCWDFFSKSESSLLFPCYSSALTGESQTITVFHKSTQRHLQHRCTPLPGGGLRVLLSEGNNTLFSTTSPNALRQYEKRLSALTQTVSEVLYCMNADWSEIKQFSSNTFYQETVNPNNNWLETYIHPEDRAIMHAAVQEAIRSKTPFDLEHRVLRLDGSTVWTSSKAVPILNEDGDIVEWVGAATDITKRKELEGQLRQWADAFHHCAHGIAVGDITSNRIIVCNDKFASILGHAPEDLLGEPILSVYHPDIRKNVRRAIRKADRRGSYRYESKMLHREGHGIFVQIDLVCICNSDGSPPYRIATMQDITHRKQMETALRSSEISALKKSAELEALIAAIPSPVFVSYDASCTNITGNAAAYEMTGIQPTVKNLSPLGELQEQLKLFEFRRDGTLLQPEDMTMMRAVSKKKRITNDELQITRPDGAIRWIYANAIPLFHENKEVWGCVCVCMDITRLKETTRALVENENKYRQLFELESDALALVEQQSLRIIDINSAFTNLYGYTRGELKDLLATDLSASLKNLVLPSNLKPRAFLSVCTAKRMALNFLSKSHILLLTSWGKRSILQLFVMSLNGN